MTLRTHTSVFISREDADSTEKKWQEVQSLIGINRHLSCSAGHSSLGPKTVLESRLEAAIAAGEHDEAERLSDYMFAREVRRCASPHPCR